MTRVTLTDTLLAAIDRRLSEIHTCLPGKIEKYEYETQKASVKPLIKKKYRDDKTESLPVIVNVPVVFPRTATASLTFPIEKDDLVLLLFTERSIELYLKEGNEQEPGDRRKFDLSDCIAIPGLYPFNDENKSKADNNDDVLLIYNETEFRITKEGDFHLKGGDLYIDGDVVAGVTFNEEGEPEDGISLTTHVHTGVEPGGGNSGPPDSTP